MLAPEGSRGRDVMGQPGQGPRAETGTGGGSPSAAGGCVSRRAGAWGCAVAVLLTEKGSR